ncbi:DNA translocase FtsK [Sporolactobacillus inulinus]|uniref:Cell division protein FtsK n=2 Tax=Sporolactobacillus inulinus TaxID=2078 RepID=A0A0U1QMG0_9BACL|nr:DNA translocase FtsK [Sporolactobacillus inulinus]KLI01971.1 cell division protein FtsK [Sporolactobacillus inulinus CASD]GEB75953.1 DNA translocase SpoIIIE [Sporolactobacillus inulinus]
MAKKKRSKKKTRTSIGWKTTLIYEIGGLCMFALTCIGISSLGAAGEVIKEAARLFTGNLWVLFLLFFLVLSVYYVLFRKQPEFFTRRLCGIYLLMFTMLLISHVRLFEALSAVNTWQNRSVIINTFLLFKGELSGSIPSQGLGGGLIGAIGFAFFYYLFSTTGTYFMTFFLFLVSAILITGHSIGSFVRKIVGGLFHSIRTSAAHWTSSFKTFSDNRAKKKKMKANERQNDTKNEKPPVDARLHESERAPEPEIHDFNETAMNQTEQMSAEELLSPSEKSDEDIQAPDFSQMPVENEDYQLPPLSLLRMPGTNAQKNERSHIAENVRTLERTFESFGVRATVKEVHLGPAVTRYEVYPEAGVKVSRILNLSDDLALALAAKDIRIEAPIPGKSAVGIEVPNQEVAMVCLREVLESSNAKRAASKLTIGLGRDISGEPILADLNRMPHLLVAGATGSGKSVCINGIIITLLMRTKPSEVKLFMIDPKMVELNVYNGIPHLLTPVVTDPAKAALGLKNVLGEMERRYELFSESGTRNLESYNEAVRKFNKEHEEKQPLMPYIVVIIDELADLMMVASKDVEETVTRLAQMARAAGIHLIIATQRPSVDIITGVIKANIPSRIAFSVSSMMDSRTILDSGGAEKLLGKGDMLFLPIGASKPVRIQGAFLSDQEVEAVVQHVVGQQKANYQQDMIPADQPEQGHNEVDDDLYDDAVQLVVNMQTASVSMLQRRFRIGYTRAARLIDAMEERHVVGPYEGSKPRTVLVPKQSDEVSGR